MKKTTIKPCPLRNLNTLVTKKHQGIQWLEHLEHTAGRVVTGKVPPPGRRLRIDIYADSYSDQGHCRMETMDPITLKWHEVAFKPSESMKTDRRLAYVPDIQTRNFAPDFAADRQWLIDTYLKLVD